jgi:ribonuclease Z
MDRSANDSFQPQLAIVGAWTKAGVASCVHVKGLNKNDDLLLDCGTCEPSTYSVKAVLVTHGHIDHAGCCINHARALALTNKSPTYFVPSAIIEPLNTAWHAYEAMNDAEIPMTIQAVKTDEFGNFLPFHATPNVLVRPFHTEHRVPSHGYALYTMRKGKLLPEYQNLAQEEIGQLRRQGIAIKSPDTEQLEIVYTGDTLFSGLLRPENAFVFEAPILIMELTYLDGKREKAIERTHIHLDDVLEHADYFHNQQIVFVHLSQKYSASMALEILRDRLPASLSDRCFVNLSSFGVTTEHLTAINDRRWSQRQRVEAGWGWTHPSQRYQSRQQHYHHHQQQHHHHQSSQGSRHAAKWHPGTDASSSYASRVSAESSSNNNNNDSRAEVTPMSNPPSMSSIDDHAMRHVRPTPSSSSSSSQFNSRSQHQVYSGRGYGRHRDHRWFQGHNNNNQR